MERELGGVWDGGERRTGVYNVTIVNILITDKCDL